MNRTLIVARMAPDDRSNVADIFARSDASGLPEQIGVVERNLFSYRGLYFHLIDFDRDPRESMQIAQKLDGFSAVSDDLRPYISAYDPATWKSPQDAMASCFYSWTPSTTSAAAR